MCIHVYRYGTGTLKIYVYTRRNELHTAQSASDVIVVEDCKIIMESSYSNESDRDEEQMSQNTSSNSIRADWSHWTTCYKVRI